MSDKTTDGRCVTMKAFMVTEHNSPPEFMEIEITPPDAGEVQIAVRACALNFADLLMIKGTYQATPPLPFVLGMEVAGEILAPDADAPLPLGWQAGDRIAAVIGHGGLAQRANIPAALAVKIPESMSYEQASAFQIAYGTSHLALDHRAGLKAGETLVVLGAAGGVGLTAVEIGKRMGARVIACARGAQKLAIAKAAGADEVLDVTLPDLRDQLKSLGGADVIYDAIGGDAGTQAARALNRGGRYLVIGFAAGGHPDIALNHALVKNITIHGVYWGGYSELAPQVLRHSLAQLFDWFCAGDLRPHISEVFPLDQAHEALDYLRTRKSTGKIVLRV
jgi:NADPH2:quinone reductase